MGAETWVAVCTGALALATFLLGFLTYRLESAWKKSSEQQVGLQTWLHFQTRFDSRELKRCRKKLARQLDPYDQSKHQEIAEELFNLFEDIGAVYCLGLLNRKLSESSFSFYVNHWWRAAKPYVDRERMLHQDDKTLFSDFEKLATGWRNLDPQIGDDALKKFLEDEKNLSVE
jgi:hypothetical protein